MKIFNRFKKRKRLYTVLLTEDQLKFLMKYCPSGGWFGEYCKNSELFKDRVCKQNGAKYKAGEVCVCFQRQENNQ
ncbi:MAG: hypothetical protein KatS3mg101_1025 [Patescibacteria group bacterium]|nr:MAG: hypothetical protein KatS3mg101_1025 [Patescibacteria group bacterium]